MIDIKIGDCRKLIHELEDESIDCVMTSPPYWGLRDYKTEPIIFDGLQDCEHEWSAYNRSNGGGHPSSSAAVGATKEDTQRIYGYKADFCSKCGAWRGQLGLEPTPELYIKHMLDFFDDVKLKLKVEGNCFVNLGDSYMGSGQDSGKQNRELSQNIGNRLVGEASPTKPPSAKKHGTLKPKSLCMVPQRFAWGMIERGWILRNEIIWAKPNHMPESVTDRLTKAHEVIYHFVKQQKYYYNLDAIREPHKDLDDNIRRLSKGPEYNNKSSVWSWQRGNRWKNGGEVAKSTKFNQVAPDTSVGNLRNGANPLHQLGKNPGDVWVVNTQPFSGSHFAVFPLELVRRPILAGCPENGTVLDPFAGSGTAGEFCRHNDRNAILFELNPEYVKLIKERSMANIPELDRFV